MCPHLTVRTLRGGAGTGQCLLSALGERYLHGRVLFRLTFSVSLRYAYVFIPCSSVFLSKPQGPLSSGLELLTPEPLRPHKCHTPRWS